MRLKRIRLYGFKTFADKTEIGLDGDIVAIVGPNGCGKSNVVDALAWGLGESNLRAVRAQTGKEVVFAGSKSRKPLGFAEVAVTFDNEDGLLPVESAEVTVSRRVDRTGENEYAINRRPCRLRDVTELLADTGLSRTGYAIVGQSEIDQALAASPAQRRSWVDEAAGVQRYRLRRTEAMRRLASADEHLARVNDLVVELRAQEEPLAREAEEARAYRELANRLQAVEAGLLAHEFAQANAALADGHARSQAAAATKAAEEAMLERSAEEALQCRAEAAQAESARAEALARSAVATREADKARTAEEVARARLASLAELGTALEDERAAAVARLEQSKNDRDTAVEELRRAQEAMASAESAGAGLEEGGAALRAALDAAEAALEAARAAEHERRARELEAAHRERRAAEARRELEGAQKALAQLDHGMAEAEAAVAEAEAGLARAREAEAAAHGRLQALRQQAEEAEARRREVLAALSKAEGKRAGLQAGIEAHDGLAAGARAVVEAAARGELEGHFVPVGEALEARPEVAAAVDAALGAAANDLIVADEHLAKRAVLWLRENRAGRATFQPLTLVQARARGTVDRLARRPGVLGVAADLVECDPAHRTVAESLLGRVLVVQDLDSAFDLVGEPGWSRAATLAGEIVHAGGAVTGGVSARHSAGLVERRAELASLADQIQGLQAQAARLEAGPGSEAEAQASLATAEAAAKTARDELEDAKSYLRALELERQETSRAVAKLEAETALPAQRTPAGGAPDVAAAETAREEALRAWLAHEAAAGGALDRAREARAAYEAAQARVAELEERASAVQSAIEAGARRRENIGPACEKLSREAADAEALQTRHRAAAEVADLEAAEWMQRRAEAEARAAAAEARAEQSRRAAAEAEAEAHRLEVAAARHDLKRAAALARLLEEYGIEEEAALRMAESEPPEKDAAAVVANLRRQIRALGEVNLGAIEAYDRLAARLAELEAQHADISAGRDQVLESVRELDRLTRDRFTETFEAVRAAFAKLFQETFGGGEAELSLVDPSDPLDSGVDIQVTLPGKRRQRLELLSGGERALGALTFLCALLKVRPSPLVVLDEVDAPLDGRNVERFVSLLRSFEGTCQFLVVTHNQVTIESADVWLGVSMQEPGVSTVVPFRASREAGSDRALAGGYMKG